MEKKTNIIASNKLFMVLYWLILAGFMLIIFYCSPFSSDDFVFSKYANAPEGFEGNLDHVIMYGNGRLLGNGLSAFLINSRAALALLKTFTFLSITFLLSELLGVRKNFALTSVIYIMVLFPSSGMFAEISNWTAGFNNYCPPIMFILAAAVLLKNIEKHTILKTVLIAVIGFA
ncbi:MAG: hypothetical protein IJS94_07470, partial [Clostridia bacterium]|nr:hypothetical protein [Clostridia bacterium]